MSTEGPVASTRRSRARSRRARAFVAGFAAVVGILAVLVLGGAALTSIQGPRVTAVSVDPEAAATASGARLIVTTTQSLAEVRPDQVTVTPTADVTLDTSGRSVGVRFSRPLWDDTEYTVTIRDLAGLGGGPPVTVTETFTTPALRVFVLQRGEDEDRILRTDLEGTDAEVVFTAAHIEDFRTTAGHLVISTVGEDDLSQLIVTSLVGQSPRPLPLPGDGHISALQSADRGELIGYLYTDADIAQGRGRESVLFTASVSLADRETPPAEVVRVGGESRVDDWRFVPGTDAILMLTFDGALTLAGPSAEPVALGNAVGILGIARGSTDAFVERIDGPVRIDLRTAEESPLEPTDPALGQVNALVPLPDGSTLRTLAILEGFTVVSTTVTEVDADGAVRPLFSVPPSDTLLQVCVSPSGRYAAILVAPDTITNPYDGYRLPLPTRLQTHIIERADGAERSVLSGFDLSWCQVPPRG